MNQQLNLNADDASAVTESIQEVLADADATADDVDAQMQRAIDDAAAGAAAEDARWVEVTALAGDITKLFDSALKQVTSLLNERYARETKAMDEELQVLGREHAELGESIDGLKALLPSQERTTQREIDELLLSGSLTASADAAEKLRELRALQSKPVVMRQRQKEISTRSEAIRAEKRRVAGAVVENWIVRVKPLVRAGEHSLLVTLLNGIEGSLNSFRDATGIKIHPGYMLELTSDAKSAEYQAGCRWYR